ncbi:MAG TPA: RDD family protein [Bryobacteraceae bacterium]
MGSTSAEALGSRLFCTECGRPFPPEDLARFGTQAVCADCKPRFVQRMREGVSSVSGVQYGGFWRRGAALLIDGMVMMIVYFPLQIAVAIIAGTSLARNQAAMVALLGAVWLIYMVAYAAYYTWFLSQKSATPGKMLMGVKVITAGGGRISVARAFARCFAAGLSGMILCLGYLMAAFDSEKRALHDHLCNTRVIRA